MDPDDENSVLRLLINVRPSFFVPSGLFSCPMSTSCRSIQSTTMFHMFKSVHWLSRIHLIWMTFDIEVDAELQFNTFLYCFYQSWDLLSSKLVPADET